MNKLLFKNRYTVLAMAVCGFLLAIVIEGQVTGRKPDFFGPDNPFFEFKIGDEKAFEEMIERSQDR